MAINVVLVNGAPGSGKTSFEDMCKYLLGPYYRTRSTVDRVKEIAKYIGWDGKKDLKGRKLLSDLKDALTAYDNIPFKDILDYIKAFTYELEQYGVNSNKGVIFVDVREPEEIDKLKKATDGITVFIHRKTAEAEKTSNHADANVYNYKYDYYIDNNGTFEQLEEEAKKFLKNIGIREFDDF